MELRSDKIHWSSIPDDILGLVAGKLVSPDDYVRFSAVCRPWYLFASGLYNTPHRRSLYKPTNPKSKRKITLRNPITAATTKLPLPETAGSCWGSPFGWLITHDHTNRMFTLVNPFTGAITPLPGRYPPQLDVRYDIKPFLTANPDSDPDYTLVVIAPGFGMLAFTSKIWCQVEGDLGFSDLTYSKGKLYGLKPYGSITPIELKVFVLQSNRGDNGRLDHRFVPIGPTLTLAAHEENEPCLIRKHIIDLNGELCFYAGYNLLREEIIFRVFKIDLLTGNLNRIWTLDDRCLFLGLGHYSFSCKARYSVAKLLGQPEHGARELLSDCVVHTSYYRSLFDVEVYGLSRLCKVGGRKKDWANPVYTHTPFWFVKFMKLNAKKMKEVKTSKSGSYIM